MLAFLKVIAGAIGILALAIVGLRLMFPLPPLEGRQNSTAIGASAETRLGKVLLPQSALHPGASGIRALQDGREAFAARILLARAAQASIDVQYYIWQKDATGLLLLDELRAAAQRGVRVRLLIDDNGIRDLDAELAALDALPNFEVRLFNPFTLRRPKAFAYFFDFPRLNRRMHNKSFTVDGVATIVGGRNVGNIYFGYGPNEQYIDTDVLAAGPAAADVGRDFDAYWSSLSAYPADRILQPAPDGLKQLQVAAQAQGVSLDAKDYQRAIRETAFVGTLVDGVLDLDWRPVTLFSDDPAKGLGQSAREDNLVGQLADLLDSPRRRLDIVSAYFVPGRIGAQRLVELSQKGVRVRVVTNALEATDVSLVHAGYARYREQILKAGIELYELLGQPDTGSQSVTTGLSGSSRTSLHAKTTSIDSARVFISSFNFDPRSANLNTEMGLLIESPDLAARMASTLDQHLAASAYRVRLAQDGALQWESLSAEGKAAITTTEPGTTMLRRAVIRLIGFLPIEWLL